MTTAGASSRPPRDLPGLEQALVDLAVRGHAASLPGEAAWFEQVGIAMREGDRWLAHPDWLACALPAPSAKDLTVRTLLRDPWYRLHIDVAVAAVCRAIGSSERWKRLDELLAGPLRALAPRVASLLARAATTETDTSWDAADTYCWGHSGAADVLFPLLVASAATWHATPVYLHDAPAKLVHLVVATSAGEGLRLDVGEAQDLLDGAAPVWVRALGDGTTEVTLTAPVHVAWPGDAPDVATHPFSLGAPAAARVRSALVSPAGLGTSSFWVALEDGVRSHAFAGTAAGTEWPDNAGLPKSQALLDLVRARPSGLGRTDEADAALFRLADHPLYGLWLQLLLLEALDRELGEETLLFAIPPGSHGHVQVLYRPRTQRGEARASMRDLGGLDAVLDRVARGVGLTTVGALGEVRGTWTLGLGLLGQVGLVQQAGERWALSGHVLDRLHGGGLMTGVIRRGKRIRETLHTVLNGLWEAEGGQR